MGEHSSKRDNASDTDSGQDELSFEKDGIEVDSGGTNIEFTWDEELSKLGAGTNWGPSACAHCAAIKLLRQAMLKSPR